MTGDDWTLSLPTNRISRACFLCGAKDAEDPPRNVATPRGDFDICRSCVSELALKLDEVRRSTDPIALSPASRARSVALSLFGVAHPHCEDVVASTVEEAEAQAKRAGAREAYEELELFTKELRDQSHALMCKFRDQGMHAAGERAAEDANVCESIMGKLAELKERFWK